MQPGSFHWDRFHSEGWLSSAFYVETPDAALETDAREGLDHFRPAALRHRAAAARPCERFVKPKPGRLVLFPSYMWHGTVPFTTRPRRG